MFALISMIINNVSPYRSSRIDALAERFINAAGISGNDFLFIEPYSMGDVYHTLALMDAFREKYCQAGQRIHMICNPRCIPVVQMFNNIHHAAALECGPHEFHLETFSERYQLAPGFPIVTAPDMYAHGWLGRLIHEGKISNIEAKKLILNLDFDTPLGRPILNETLRQLAYENAKNQGLETASIIIFNHTSLQATANPDIFECLSKSFKDRVFYDASVPHAPKIAWARPLNIPIDQVIYFSEYAGNVVAMRSGIVDIISEAKCNLITIYPNSRMYGNPHQNFIEVARVMRRFKLKEIGLRTGMKEHCLDVEEDESAKQTGEKLRVLVEEIMRTLA